MKNRRHANTHREYRSPDNSLYLPKTPLLDQSSVTESSRGLRALLNEKEIELLHMHTKCFKWKQKCREQEAKAQALSEKLFKTEDAYKALREKYKGQVQAAKSYEERRSGLEHFQIADPPAVRLQQSQIASLQSQIEALEAAQAKVLCENERLKRPKEETEAEVRVVLADLTEIFKDVGELNKVLKVFLNREEYSVSTLMGTLLSKIESSHRDVCVWTRLVNIVRSIGREVEEMRIGLAAFTESRRKNSRGEDYT